MPKPEPKVEVKQVQKPEANKEVKQKSKISEGSQKAKLSGTPKSQRDFDCSSGTKEKPPMVGNKEDVKVQAKSKEEKTD